MHGPVTASFSLCSCSLWLFDILLGNLNVVNQKNNLSNFLFKYPCDKDHDGRLTLEDMIENPYSFYGSVYLSFDDEVVVCVNND